MTAAPRKGRKVSFAADAAAPQADPWSQISTLRFMIHPLYGGELLVEGVDHRQIMVDEVIEERVGEPDGSLLEELRRAFELRLARLDAARAVLVGHDPGLAED